MNLAILQKTTRQTATLAVLVIVGAAGFEALWTSAIAHLGPTLIELWSRLEFAQRLLKVLANIDLSDKVSLGALVSIGLAHPILLALTWGFIIALCTSVTVGEIDRGTADLLLTLPLSRTCIFVTNTVVWVVAAAAFSLAAWLGLAIGNATMSLPKPLNLVHLGIVSVNLLALNLAVGGMTTLISCLLRRRGNAVGIVIAILLVSFLINFLEALLPVFEHLRFLGFLNYYRPAVILRDGAWPIANLVVLMAIAVTTWTAGLLYFTRRDIPAP